MNRVAAPALCLVALLAAACFFERGGLAPTGDARVGAPDIAAADAAALDLRARDARDRDAEAEDLTADLTADPDAADQSVADACGPLPLNTIRAPAATSLTVDGNLDDWDSACWVSISAPGNWVSLDGSAESASDLSCRLAVRWDAGALYLAFEVTDDVHHNPYSADPANLWEGDSVQIAFDMGGEGGQGYDDLNDFEYGWAGSGPEVFAHCWEAPGRTSADMPGSQAVRRTGTITTYEARLPATGLGVGQFNLGDSFRFSAVVNDDDADGVGRSGYIEWTSGVGTTKNPGQFGTLTLVP